MDKKAMPRINFHKRVRGANKNKAAQAGKTATWDPQRSQSLLSPTAKKKCNSIITHEKFRKCVQREMRAVENIHRKKLRV